MTADPKHHSKLATVGSRSDSIRRMRFFTAGGFLLIAGVLLGYGAVTSFGILKTAAVFLTLTLAGTAVVDKRFFWLPRFVVLVVVTSFTLLVVDVGLWAVRYRVDKRIGLRGLFTNDPTIGYRLNPNWQGVYDDGVVRDARYVVNSLGHRDDEPGKSIASRAFIVGDSYAFGDLLDEDETIDRQIEKMTNGKVDAYNLGVAGYGTPAALYSLKNADLPGQAAIYLFYENDLRNDGYATQENSVRRGFLVRTKDDSGDEIDVRELDERIDEVLSPYTWMKDAIRLRHIAQFVTGATRKMRLDENRERDEAGTGPLDYNIKNVQLGFEHTLAMQSLASERGMNFLVFVIPSMREVVAGRQHDRVVRYLARLEEAGIPMIDPFSEFATSDYYIHDGHFNPIGAKKAASRLVEWLHEVEIH